MGDFIGGGTPSSANIDFWQGNIPWISSSDLKEDNIHSVKISRFITKCAVENSATKLCIAPFIAVVSRVGVGKVAYCAESLCTSQDFTNIINLKGNGVFLSYLISKIMKLAAASTQGTSIKGITANEIKNKKIILPRIEEQEKIAAFLSLLDTRLSTQSKIFHSG